MITDWTQKRVVVMGLGRFGGGVGVARYLAGQGASVLVTDMAPPEKLEASLGDLAGLPIEYNLAEHRTDDFTNADLIVINPAIDPRYNQYLQAAAEAGVPTTSEIRLLVERLSNRDRTIGITGTAGKSTVTSMIGHVLSKHLGADRVHVGGNLGGSLLESLEQIQPDDWVVLELSSFMLEGLGEDRWSPHIAVVTNFSPNHLDRHGTVEAYQAAKQAIVNSQHPGHDIAVFGPGIHDLFDHKVQRMVSREQDDLDAGSELSLLLPGRHNQMNALLAADTAEEAIDIQWWQAAESLNDFSGLPHRLQLVVDHAGVRYFNDSKSTTREAAMLAIESFDRGLVHAIVGGFDKHTDLRPMARLAGQHCKAIYTIGATGNAIADECEAAAEAAQIIRCDTLDDAVAATIQRLRRGDIVLLSPGCASWDQFENYEQRGRAFAKAVLKYTAEGGPAPR